MKKKRLLLTNCGKQAAFHTVNWAEYEACIALFQELMVFSYILSIVIQIFSPECRIYWIQYKHHLFYIIDNKI